MLITMTKLNDLHRELIGAIQAVNYKPPGNGNMSGSVQSFWIGVFLVDLEICPCRGLSSKRILSCPFELDLSEAGPSGQAQ